MDDDLLLNPLLGLREIMHAQQCDIWHTGDTQSTGAFIFVLCLLKREYRRKGENLVKQNLSCDIHPVFVTVFTTGAQDLFV